MNKKLILLLAGVSLGLTTPTSVYALTQEQKEWLTLGGAVVGTVAAVTGAVLGVQWLNDKLTSDEKVYNDSYSHYITAQQNYVRILSVVEHGGSSLFDLISAEPKIERLIGGSVDDYRRSLDRSLKDVQSYKTYLEKRFKKLLWDNPLKYSFENLLSKYVYLIEKLQVIKRIVERIQEARIDQKTYADHTHTVNAKREWYRQEYDLLISYSNYCYSADTQLITIAQNKGMCVGDYRYPLMNYAHTLSSDMYLLQSMISTLEARLSNMYKRYDGCVSYYPLIHNYEAIISQLRNYSAMFQRIYDTIVHSVEYRHEKSRKEFEEQLRRQQEENRRKEMELRCREENLKREKKRLEEQRREQCTCCGECHCTQSCALQSSTVTLTFSS